MKFLIDAQLPPALAAWLQRTGHEAIHVRDVGLREADDAAIWNYAVQNGTVIVTKDEDFVARSVHTAESTPPVVVWLRVGNATNRALEPWIEARLAGIVELLEQGHRLVEVI